MARGLTDKDIAQGVRDAQTSGRTVILRDTGRTPGLQLVITSNGTASWSLLFTPKGEAKPVRLKLARHGSRDDRGAAYGLVQARLEAGALRERIARGENPMVERQQAAIEERAKLDEMRAEEAARKAEADRLARRMTVTKLAELYFAARANDRGMKRMRQMIEFSVLPVIGTRIVEELRKADIQRVMDEVAARGNATQPQRVLEALRPMLKFALEREYMPADRDGIWLKLRLPKRDEARERVLTAREIAWLWERTGEWLATDPTLARVIRLDMLLGQRSNEVCAIRFDEIAPDFMQWVLPPERTKNGKAHVLPLPPLARTVMREAVEAARSAERDPDAPPREHVFIGERGAVWRADTVAHRLAAAIAAWNDAHTNDKVDPFVVHDLRRTMATRLQEAGIGMTVIGVALNHISAKKASVTTKHYAHGDMSLAVRAAMSKWQGLVEQCIAGSDPFSIRVEDIEAVERRALAEVRGGKPGLAIVS